MADEAPEAGAGEEPIARPGQGEEEADEGQVGVAAGHRLAAHPDEADDGDERAQEPEPADGQPLHVPPLRERAGDIPELAGHFLGKACAFEGRTAKRLTPEALALLAEYRWPGNVRELRNLMERAAILVEGPEVGAEDLASWLEAASPSEESSGLRGEIERREAEAIRKSLDQAGWNVTQAAAGLGIDRTNLHRKMRKYGIARR